MATMNQDRVAFLTPLIRGAFGALAKVIAAMDAAEVLASLQLMASDPTEVLIWENIGRRAWDEYEAGRPLGAERVELTVAPSLSVLTIEHLLTLLETLATGDRVRLLPTSEPWRVLVRAPGLPRVTVETWPTLDLPEDLLIRIVLGANSPAERLFKPGQMEALWKQRSAQALQHWLSVNQTRPLTAHPAFAEVVEQPVLGMPGVYLIRRPPMPYSPLLPVALYQSPVAWAVFETAEELAASRAYYRQPGASFFAELPLFRNRPPCSAEPTRMADGVAVDHIRVVRTPWDGAGAISVYTMSDKTLQKRPELRQEAYRGRYLIHVADDAEQALALWRKAGLEVHQIEWPSVIH
ncbi:hypothetical protein HN018_28295 (plasmid) [Lichenicola cladoniae]|uniref:Uncharacterized protein n=1 Tax=Lichenicola cladoniae TaxID=1484109 RepID=A0A6M8I1G9_9PROT|nr:hypothetical protein [Lichenicola cladoniae]NPD69796.1 hypothetical protein [Acetobacteraceae bacterium]QKE94027.1 hypothetical protein HN018_28295 [Lichenicola cladoniae]